MLWVFYGQIRDLCDGIEGQRLSLYRQERLDRQGSEKARQQGIAGELLLYRALARFCPELPQPPAISADSWGKPVLEDLDLHFSISHSAELAACALADFPVGLDLQVITAPTQALVRRCLSEREQDCLAKVTDKAAVFTVFWTRKESWLKALGTGVDRPLSGLDTLALEELPPAERPAFFDFTLPGYAAAVCALGGASPQPELLEKQDKIDA